MGRYTGESTEGVKAEKIVPDTQVRELGAINEEVRKSVLGYIGEMSLCHLGAGTDEIMERTNANPLLITEVLESLCEGGEIEATTVGEGRTKSQVYVTCGRTYYTTRKEAEAVRRKGDRIYYSEKEKAYYIRRIKKPFWGW